MKCRRYEVYGHGRGLSLTVSTMYNVFGFTKLGKEMAGIWHKYGV